MNYETMQSQAREKQEGRRHRLARQTKTGRVDPSRANYTGNLAAAFVGLATLAAAVIALF